MFIRVEPIDPERVSITFEGRELRVGKGLNLAAALLEAGVAHFRDTPVTASPRAPFCAMGICFDCLVVVDGVPNQQSCLIEVRDGMEVARQSGVADLLADGPASTEGTV